MKINSIFDFLYLPVLLLLIPSCTKQERFDVNMLGQMVDVSFDTVLTDTNETKTSYDAMNHLALWKREDMAGVVASYGAGLFTDARMQNFSIRERNDAGGEFLSTATFSGKLTDKGSQTYTYYAVYPYTAFQTVADASAVSSRLEERQYPDLKSWDGACDMLASRPVTTSSPSVAASNLQIRFTRLFGMLRLKFGAGIADTYGAETVETISIESVAGSDKLAGKFTINLASTEAPDPVMSTAAGDCFNKVTLDYRGKNAQLSNIDAYFVLNPGTYDNVVITIKTRSHTLTLPRSALSIGRGEVASTALNWESGDTAIESASLLPRNPETLKILTFGHSYVDDSMAYMDELLNDAGVTNVTFAHFYIGNCYLQTYWKHVQNAENTKGGSDKITYYKRIYDGNKVTMQETSKTIIEALCDEKWDVVVFQTNSEKLGYYEYFAKYLQNMIDYVKTTCQAENAKVPVLAWHMFWAFGSQSSYVNDNYYGSQELNYSAHVQAAKQILRNTDIQLVIPTGTTIQSLRHSSLNNPYTGTDAYEFLRDGTDISHLDRMAGRYAAACTWFEFFMKPCFGISVLGNTFMPSTSYAGVPVTEENREFLQRAAILACQSPFEICHLDVVDALQVMGGMEAFNSLAKDGTPKDFDLIDNLVW